MSNTVEINIVGHDSASDEIARVAAALAALKDKTVKVKVDADKNALRNSVNEAVKSYNKASVGKSKLDIEVSPKNIKKSVDGAVKELNRRGATTVEIDVNSKKAHAEIAALKAAIKSIPGDDIDMHVDANTAKATSKILALAALLEALDNKTIDVDVKVDDSALRNFDKALSRKERTAKVKVGLDESGMKDIDRSIESTGDKIRRLSRSSKEAARDIDSDLNRINDSARGGVDNKLNAAADKFKRNTTRILNDIDRSINRSTRPIAAGLADELDRLNKAASRLDVDKLGAKQMKSIVRDLEDANAQLGSYSKLMRSKPRGLFGDDGLQRIKRATSELEKASKYAGRINSGVDLGDLSEKVTKSLTPDSEKIGRDIRRTLDETFGRDYHLIPNLDITRINDDLNRLDRRLESSGRKLGDAFHRGTKQSPLPDFYSNAGRLTERQVKDVYVDVRYRVGRLWDLPEAIRNLNKTETINKLINVETHVNHSRPIDRGVLAKLNDSIASLNRVETVHRFITIKDHLDYDRSALNKLNRLLGNGGISRTLRNANRGFIGFSSGFSNALGRMTRGIPVVGALFRGMAAIPGQFIEAGMAVTRFGNALAAGGGAMARFGPAIAGLGKVAGPIGAAAASALILTTALGALSAVGVIGTAAITAGAYATQAALFVVAGAVSAVSAAIAGGLAAPFVYFAAQSEEVKAAWEGLGDSVSETMREISKPVEPALISAAKGLQTAFDSLRPTLDRVSQGSADMIDGLVNRLPAVASTLGPALEKAFSSGAQHMDVMASRLPALSQAIGNFFDKMGSPEVVNAARQAWDHLPGVIEKTGSAIQGLSSAYTGVTNFLESDKIEQFRDGWSSFTDEMSNTDWSPATEGIARAMNSFGNFLEGIDGADVAQIAGGISDAFANLTNMADKLDLTGILAGLAGFIEGITALGNAAVTISGLEGLISAMGLLADAADAAKSKIKEVFNVENAGDIKDAFDGAEDSIGNIRKHFEGMPAADEIFGNIDAVASAMEKLRSSASLPVAEQVKELGKQLDYARNRMSAGEFQNLLEGTEATLKVIPEVADEELKGALMNQSITMAVKADPEDINRLNKSQAILLDAAVQIDPHAATDFANAFDSLIKISPDFDMGEMDRALAGYDAIVKASLEISDSSPTGRMAQQVLGEQAKIYAEIVPQLKEGGFDAQLQSYIGSNELIVDVMARLNPDQQLDFAQALRNQSIEIQAALKIEDPTAQLAALNSATAGFTLEIATAVAPTLGPEAGAALNELVAGTEVKLKAALELEDPSAQLAGVNSALEGLVSGLEAIKVNFELDDAALGILDGMIATIKAIIEPEGQPELPTADLPVNPVPEGQPDLPPADQPVVPKPEGEVNLPPAEVDVTPNVSGGSFDLDLPPKEIILYPKVDLNQITPPGGVDIELNPKVKVPDFVQGLSNNIKQQINDAVEQGYDVAFSKDARTQQIKVEFINPNGQSIEGAHGFFGNIPPQDVPVQPAADSLAAFDSAFQQAGQPMEVQIIPRFDGAAAFGVIPPMPVQILPQFDGAMAFGAIPPMPVQILPQFDGAMGFGLIPPMPVQIIPQFDGALGFGLIPPMPVQIIPQFDGALGFGMVPPIPVQIIPQFDGAIGFGMIPPIPVQVIPQFDGALGFGMIPPIPVQIIPQFNGAAAFGLIPPMPVQIIPQLSGPVSLPPMPVPVIPTVSGPVQLPPATVQVTPVISGGVTIPPATVQVTASPSSVPVTVTPASHTIAIVPSPGSIDIPVTPSTHTIAVVIGPYTLPGNSSSTHTINVVVNDRSGGVGRGGRFSDLAGFSGGDSYGAAGAASSFNWTVQSATRSILTIANAIERGIRNEYSRLARRASEVLGEELKRGLKKQAPKLKDGLKDVIKPIEKGTSQAEKAGKKFVKETTEIGPGGTWKGTQKFAKEVEKGAEGIASSTDDGSKKISQSQKSMEENLAAYKEKYEKLPKDVELPKGEFSMSMSGGGGGGGRSFSKGADQAAKDIAQGTKTVTDAADKAEEEWDGVNRKFKNTIIEIGPGGTFKGKQEFSQQWKDAVKAGIEDTIDWIDDHSGPVPIGPLVTADNLVEPGIASKVSSAISQITSAIGNLDAAGAGAGLANLGSAITEGLASAPQAAAQAGNEIISALNQSLTGATGDFSGLAQGVSNALNDARTAAQNVLNDLGIDIQIPPVNIPTEFMPPQIPMIPEIPPEQIETMLTPPPVFPPMPPAPNVVVDVMANVDRVLSDIGAIPKNVETKAETETNAATAAAEIKSLDGMNTSSTHTINVVESGGGSGGGRRRGFSGFGMAGFGENFGMAGAIGGSSTLNVSSTLRSTLIDVISKIQSNVLTAWQGFGASAGLSFQSGLTEALKKTSVSLSGGINFIEGAKKIFERIMAGIGAIFNPGGNSPLAPGIPTISVYEDGKLVAFELAEGIRDGNKFIVRAGGELAGQVEDAVFHIPEMVKEAAKASEGFSFTFGGLKFEWGGLFKDFKSGLERETMRMSAGYLNEYGQWVVYHVNDNRVVNNNFDGGLVGDPERQAKAVTDVLSQSPSAQGKLRMLTGSGRGI